ncbi:RNA polymerase sigma-B factor [Nakamurella panacisegetis]|uniref:RNA polymerase sigma-B factor n=1 Tax=Nakamurella panacisegetis TaxID=1090615 RepID=A0A1H0SU28_9ACTN|nr:sigma-70 family RNA polymerase sigma factor [Nakamurella panacisegetis]SDP45184.1 RNA polymerase sigma-B factor [Nakamurella panacisegetis]
MSTVVRTTNQRHTDAEQRAGLERLVKARADGSAAAVRAAEHDVICSHLTVATTLARRYRNRGVDFEDLHQLARLGLVKAVKRWRPEVGTDFLPFAFPTIIGEMKRFFRDHGTMIRIPRAMQELRAEASALSADLEQYLGRPATDAEVAAAAGVDVDEMRKQRAAAASCRMLSTDLQSVNDRVVEHASPEADHDLEQAENLMILQRALAALPEREREVLWLRYFEDKSQQQISEAIGVSQMQISRILRATLTRLKAQMSADGEGSELMLQLSA